MPNPDPNRLYDCIVMGGGIAGVTAARDLQRRNLAVLLIEGADRIGGRMLSVRDFVRRSGQPLPVEAGAEYIHVDDKDRYRAFWDELRAHGFEPRGLPKYGLGLFKYPRNRIFFSEWRATKTLIEAISSPAFWDVPELLNEIQDFGAGRDDLSAADFITRSGLANRARTLAQYTLSAHTPGALDALSIKGLWSDRIIDQLEEPIEFRIELPGSAFHGICGYDTLPRKIADAFVAAGGALALSARGSADFKVTRIERGSAGAMTVRTANGMRFQGRSAVCTFSAGMLNPASGEGRAILGPLMTPEKEAALDIVRMGAITKFSLAFKERLWVDDGGHAAGGMTVLSHPRGKARTFFSVFPAEQTGPHVLTGLLMNQDHDRIAPMSDQDAVTHLLGVLNGVYGRGEHWTPASKLDLTAVGTGPGFLRKDWARDPFAKGGNSYLRHVPPARARMPVTEAREALKDPRATLPLFWAGEATASAYGTSQPLAVHGAYDSGRGAATDVQAYLVDCQGDAAHFADYYRRKYG